MLQVIELPTAGFRLKLSSCGLVIARRERIVFCKRRDAMVTLPAKMQAEITAVVAAAAKKGVLVRAYFEAEKIRQAHIADNVALEDIVEAIIVQSTNGPGYESDPSDALAALLGESTAETEPLH
jgi:hypothetical protein